MIQKLTLYTKKYAIFGMVFSLAKATVYFVPLLLADVLSKSDFGILEYALAGLGMIVNTLINLGVPGAYPYFVLKDSQDHLTPTFRLHAIVLIIPLVINQILFFGFGLDASFYLAFNVSYIIANQVFYSTQLKSHERSTVAVIIDSGIYFFLLFYYIAYQLKIITSSLELINKFILAYAIIYVFFAIQRYLKHKTEVSFQHYKTILKFSIHLLISTFLIYLITSSGRILVELFFDFESVGIYAFYFRLAAIVVMIHQVINIAFFKKIYTFEPKILDKYYFLFFIFIFCLSIIIYFIAPFVVGHFSGYFNETFKEHKAIYFILSAQMVMWIASALNSNIIDRENLASKNNSKFLVLVVVGAGVLYTIKSSITLSMLTYVVYSIIFLACMIQYFSLSRKSIYFQKSALSLAVIYMLTSIYYFINF
ncbi:oligosaccharide flippase family protein [Subsaximicrobium wynnwilliamsii]|jgi:O-antigen/teichoic acid export membrane protein|uniref:Oligosaccharide flippase family protein n=1 Tax=Subsaximicrobium wynnwilliamsii TaxID=291179 RepID=A0A5C6ZIF5_9FLAO|nr:oligosaccharide flippase family protein [Subsaximicrobium wynnwilliamsii]TXD83950.1 oligosaccharide flippase family protein [Subsaximicrobium wynnwilliamsii]TXD89690.1 oligosaccharide flippase family protein [Subsaximicrobium wynnwilliamsii]TXE01675.1 oligosaccharide flippase family protein [Subsaximicrobium wynnwilliamsii]